MPSHQSPDKRKYSMPNENNTPILPILIAEAGPDRGREITVPEGEISLGRSSQNDVCLVDPILSRHHCRISFHGGVLSVEDLDSANGTLVNGEEVKTAQLHDGDTVTIGDTVLRVRNAPKTAPLPEVAPPPVIDLGPSTAAEEGAPASSSAMAEGPTSNGESPTDLGTQDSSLVTRHSSLGGGTAPVVDLGFDKTAGDAIETKKPNWRPLIWGLGAVAVLFLAVSLILRTPEEEQPPVVQTPKEPPLTPLEIEYEKVEASTAGVFRYRMVLEADGRLAVEIGDMNEDRHGRNDTILDSNKVERLAKDLDKSGFFFLTDKYEGVAPEGVLGSLDITVIANKRVKRVEVLNRVEPDVFRNVRESLETFGKNELGIWAIQFSREKLVELAEEALTRARNTFEERGIDYGNTYNAIKRFEEAAFYLDTVDPKPDFYGDIVTGLAQATEELNAKYEEQRFLADRAINLKDWNGAARELRILREMIPNRDDERYIEAGRKLLDVENRLKSKDK
jgi:pSer/pThr/pTyr-binding forkhead associated (FHA) protein